jgi:hypothetical protein
MEHSNAVRPFSAIISAGGQAGEDLASLLGVREKCAAVYNGKALARFAVEAAVGAGATEVVLVCGDEVRVAVDDAPCKFAPPGKNPVDSARNGLSELDSRGDIVFIPGDLPLIQSQHVLDFVAAIPPWPGEWLATGVCTRDSLEDLFGEVRGVGYLKVDGREYAAASLSAASRPGFESALALLTDIADDRKSQLRMALRFGLFDIARLYFGRMTTERAELAAKRLFGCPCKLITECAPELVMDVDTPEDWFALPRPT